jgi:hypothetical protein
MSDNKGKYRTEIQQVRGFHVISFAIVCVIMRFWTGRITMRKMFWSRSRAGP